MGAGNLELMLSQGYEDMMESATPIKLDDRSYRETISHVITEIADGGNLVVIGRGGQMILRDKPDTVHIQLVAGADERAARVMRDLSISEEEARKRMRNFNRSREAFHKKFWKVDVWDPRLYDLVINTTNVSYDAAADCVIQITQSLTSGSAASD
jgi:cytidylate kinase